MAPPVRERDFEKVGGLKEHIRALKEMIIYPLLYRELFDSHGIDAPRGVLFHGPPGTGKTLVAGAVATECSKCSNRRVTFYVRKGADCLNKYVGETEKHLQNLFNQARNNRPAIIFFDEIDGLVPTRSQTQEHVHASVVSTLLALMDGLDSKSEVFVIGATNRIDMIDPALRRPGRFDRELYFPLPPLESRIQIFRIHTRGWKHKPTHELILKLASECIGYCGADIQSLCSQAVMKSFHRNFPQVSDTSRRFPVNYKNIKVREEDFWAAKEKIVPASQRVYLLPSRPLTPELEPLLRRNLDECLDYISKTCPFKFLYHNREELSKNKSFSCPRFLLLGNQDQGQSSHLAPAILHHFDHLPVTVIDLSSMNEEAMRSTDSNSLIHKIEEARQSMPGILYFPEMTSWWDLIDETAKLVLVASIAKLDASSSTQLFIFATATGSTYEDLPSEIKKIFPKKRSFFVFQSQKEERVNFFTSLLVEKNLIPPKVNAGSSPDEVCEEADKEDETQHTYEKYESEPEGRRRSLRQRGLDVEFLGITYESKPRLGSFFRRYIDQGPYMKNSAVVGGKRQRFSKPIKRHTLFDDVGYEVNKKVKVDLEDSSLELGVGDIPVSGEEPPIISEETAKELVVDSKKLEQLVQNAVNITSDCPMNTIIKLYEDLEIVCLRYASTWDRSQLPEELEREISIFNPS